MEEDDEVRAIAAVSPPTADENPKMSREEGELSSSDNDEIPTVSAAPSSAAASDLEEAGQVASLFKTLEDMNVGKCLHKASSRSFGELPSSVSSLPNCQRSTQRSRTPFVPFVINFSDDESGSESEEFMQSKALEIKGSSLAVKENKKPPVSLVPKSQLSRQTTHITNSVPSRASLSRTFTSSMTNFSSQTSRNSRCSVIDRRYQSGNFRISNTKLLGQEQGDFRNLKSDGSKVQDLRQQIETMEKELKLKSVKQHEDNVSGSFRNYNVSDSEIDAPNKCRKVSADFTGFEMKELEKKRVKLSEHCDILQISDAHQHMPPLERGVQLGKDAVDNSNKKGISAHGHQERKIARVCVQSDSDQLEKQEGILGIISAGNRFTNVQKEQAERVANTSAEILSKEPRNTELKHPDMYCTQIANQFTRVHNRADGDELPEGRFVEKALEPIANSRHQAWGNDGRKRHLETSDAFLSDARLCGFLDSMGISQDNDINMETLFGIEEMQDKELEEAQEHRLKCELEERNALRAYRKAQRTLVEANARCLHLYRKRELCSAHVRSLMMENSRLSQSSGLQTGKNSWKYIVDDDVGDLPTLSHQMLDVFDVHNEQDHLSNINTFDAIHIEQEQLAAGKHRPTDLCSVPHDSTSTLQKDGKVADRACFPSTGLSASTDEDEETFPFVEKSVDSNLRCRERAKVTHNEPKKGSSLDTSQDSLLLEATLRSQLFSRLGTKALSKNKGLTHNLESAFEPRAEHNGDEGQAGINIGNVSSSVIQENLYSAPGGNEVGKQEDTVVGLKNRNQDFDATDYKDESYNVGQTESELDNLRFNSTDDTRAEKSPMSISSEKVGCYTSNIAIDPFWPLCLFELRGKCNNDECPWQHIKNQSCRDINIENTENLDLRVEVANNDGKTCVNKHSTRGLDSHGFMPPTYVVSLDMMKADSHLRGSLLPTSVQQWW